MFYLLLSLKQQTVCTLCSEQSTIYVLLSFHTYMPSIQTHNLIKETAKWYGRWNRNEFSLYEDELKMILNIIMYECGQKIKYGFVVSCVFILWSEFRSLKLNHPMWICLCSCYTLYTLNIHIQFIYFIFAMKLPYFLAYRWKW